MIETFQPNNGIFERDSEVPRRFFGQPLLSRITLRQSVAQSAFKLPWDKETEAEEGWKKKNGLDT